jgi:hypothetical protein
MGTKDKHCSLMMSQARSSLIPNRMVFSLSSLEDLNYPKTKFNCWIFHLAYGQHRKGCLWQI